MVVVKDLQQDRADHRHCDRCGGCKSEHIPQCREFAAWLVPRQNSTGGKARLGGISKREDSYLRRLLVNSAHTVLLCSKAAKADSWLTSLLNRKPRLVVAVALANKTARIAWPS
jgi:transposase